MTSLGIADVAAGDPATATLFLDGQPELTSTLMSGTYTIGEVDSTMGSVPSCYVVPAGTTIDVVSSSTNIPNVGRAWGYLATM